MTKVKALTMLLSVIDHGYSSYVIHHLPSLRVEQIIPAVAPPVTVYKSKNEREKLK